MNIVCNKEGISKNVAILSWGLCENLKKECFMKRLIFIVSLIFVSSATMAQMKIHDNGKAIFATDPSETPKGQVHVKSDLNDLAQTLYLDAPKEFTLFQATFASLYLGNSNNTDNNYARLNFGDGDAPAVSAIAARIENHGANSGTLEFWTRQAGQQIAKRMTVLANGDVNIGGGPISYMFSVNGDASKIGGGTWKVPSDRRLKKDIAPFTDGLNQVLKMQPVNFRYNGLAGISDTETQYVGVIAQDVQKVAPYTVKTMKDGYLEFDSNAVVYMLINAIKEQQAQIDRLEAQVKKYSRGGTR
jgi:hypothetical protein